MSSQSPYRPPQEIDPADVSPLPFDSGVFRFHADEQRTIGRLAKYLRDIGGLLIFVSVLSFLAMAFSVLVTFSGGLTVAAGLATAQQLLNIGFLLIIGKFMRTSALPLQAVAETPDGHATKLMTSMSGLRRLYGTKILYLIFGIAVTLLTLIT